MKERQDIYTSSITYSQNENIGFKEYLMAKLCRYKWSNATYRDKPDAIYEEIRGIEPFFKSILLLFNALSSFIIFCQ